MAMSAMSEMYTTLNTRAGDPRKVEAILADWGLDEEAINRLLGEYGVDDALKTSELDDMPGAREAAGSSSGDVHLSCLRV